MSIPFDIAALSAQIFDSLPVDDSDSGDEAEEPKEGCPETVVGIDFLSDDFLNAQLNGLAQEILGQNSISGLAHDSGECPEESNTDTPSCLSTTRASTQESESISHHPSAASPLDTSPSHQSSLDTDSHPPDQPCDDYHVTQLIQSLIGSTIPSSPAPIPLPLIASPSQPLTSNLIQAIDPMLESLVPSPPATLSTPHSPQPILRSDASTSQLLLAPAIRLNQTTKQTKTTLSSFPSISFSSVSPTQSHVSTASLDLLANPPPGQQPNYPWWTIIRAAIMGSRYGMMTRDEICEALMKRWEYFRSTSDGETRIWKSAVGHNLSVKECFVRVYVQGEGNASYYIVDTAVDPAKGRLSKNKSATGSERLSVPTIARDLVLPPNLNLSTQARWSPAIAAIRNAKHGYPRTPPSARTVYDESSSDTEQGDSDSDESESESSSLDPPQPDRSTPPSMSGFRLGGSLSAILADPGPRRCQSASRLAFSRSLSNALVGSSQPPTSSRRRAQSPQLRPVKKRTAKASNTRLTAHPNSQAHLTSAPCPTIIKHRVIPIPHQHTTPSVEPKSAAFPQPSSPRQPTLEEQVAAALADVEACIPEIVEIDIEMEPAPLASPLLFDLENLVKEVQAEVESAQKEIAAQEEPDDIPEPDDEVCEQQQKEVQAEPAQQDPRLPQAGAGEKETNNILPTAEDFDHLFASILSQEEDAETPTAAESPAVDAIDSQGAAAGVKRSADDANLDLDLLQNLIDEAVKEDQVESRELEQQVEDESEDTFAGESVAAQMLDAAIADALTVAEEREKIERERELAEREKARLKALSTQISSSLAGLVQFTDSGDIPVHPLPVERVAPTAAPPPTPAPVPRPRPVAAPRHVHRQAQPKPALHRIPMARPITILRQSLGTQQTSVDRRTRASGTRTTGRRLNLPLPSSHTSVDDRIDETALAPSLLESIQVVTLDRPRSTFPELAKEAILSHPGGKMTAAEIFKVVEKKYPFFVSAPDSWKATMRNVLTSHSCFVKIPRPADAPGRGDWWSTVDLPLWKRRRTTAKAKQDEDFLGRHAREQQRKGKIAPDLIRRPVLSTSVEDTSPVSTAPAGNLVTISNTAQAI